MSKANKAFGKVMTGRIKELVDGAEIHKDTHHIVYQMPTLPEGLTPAILEQSIDFINGTGLAVEAATMQIGQEQFPETKIERWDGQLKAFDGLTFNSDVRLREVVGEDTMFGVCETFIDHPHSTAMVEWYSDFSSVNQDRAKKLFD